MRQTVEISEIDKRHIQVIRENVSSFLKKCGNSYDKEGILLDIAPQDHEGAIPYFKKAKVFTLDINPKSKADYILNICNNNSNVINDNHFDFVVCTEVLEHTLNPFEAVEEIYRILKPDGFVFVTTPFNFRIHGPLPDCWRFTKYGLKALFKKFNIVELNEVKTEKRELMPVHYSVIATK